MKKTQANKTEIVISLDINDYVKIFPKFNKEDQLKIYESIRKVVLNQEMHKIKKRIKTNNLTDEEILQELTNYKSKKKSN